jgi:uncharacterized protein (TIGR03437 family)
MLTTNDNPTFPTGYTASYLQRRFFSKPGEIGDGPSVDTFISENSYGQTSMTGKVFGPYRLQQNLPTSCDGTALLNSGILAASAEANMDAYSRYILTFPAKTCVRSGVQIAGLGTLGCSVNSAPPVGFLTASISWVPILPYYSPGYEAQVFYHEFGHNLGLAHARSEEFDGEALGPIGTVGFRYEYGDPFDAMAFAPGQYSAAHKGLDLGWLRPDETITVTKSGTYNVLPLEVQSGVRALRILRDADTNSWLWAEFRQPIGETENELGNYLAPDLDVFQGVALRHEPSTASSAAARSDVYALDFNPDTFYLDDGTLKAGEQWADPYSPLRLTVHSVGPAQLSLVVDYDPPCAQAIISEDLFGFTQGSGSIAINAPEDCEWSALSPTSWITLLGATSGLGNGSVQFAFSANTGTDQRAGSVVIGRQSVRILQAGQTAVTVLQLSPAQGAGDDQIFTLNLKHRVGGAAPELVVVDFAQGGRSVCNVRLVGKLAGITASQTFSLDSGGGFVTAPGCTLQGAGSSYVGSATSTTYRLHLTFPAAAAGLNRIWVQAGPLSSVNTRFAVGHWQVPDCAVNPQQANVSVPADALSGSFHIVAGPGCHWTAAGHDPWLFTSSSGNGDGAVQFTLSATNPSAIPRTATLSVSDRTITVTQLGAAVAFSLLPVSRTISPKGADGEIAVSGTLDAPWNAVSSAAWLTVSGPDSGVNAGTVRYHAEANPLPQTRSATLTVGNAVFTITQPGINTVAITSILTASGGAEISPNAWIQIKGNLLVPPTTPAAGVIWSDAPDFAQGKMPTNLQGIRVTVNGRPGYVYFFCSAATSAICDEDQINVLTPLDGAVGPAEVVVYNHDVPSPAFNVPQRLRSPALLQFDAARHVVGVHADGSLLGPKSLYPGQSSPADWFEPVVLFGVGWGLGSVPLVEGGVQQSGAFPGVSCSVGGIAVTPAFAGLISPGLTQINLRVPLFLGGDVPVECRVDGYTMAVEALLAVLN